MPNPSRPSSPPLVSDSQQYCENILIMIIYTNYQMHGTSDINYNAINFIIVYYGRII